MRKPGNIGAEGDTSASGLRAMICFIICTLYKMLLSRMKLAGRISCVGEIRIKHKIFVGKTESKRSAYQTHELCA
jgi:hypothetical protein